MFSLKAQELLVWKEKRGFCGSGPVPRGKQQIECNPQGPEQNQMSHVALSSSVTDWKDRIRMKSLSFLGSAGATVCFFFSGFSVCNPARYNNHITLLSSKVLVIGPDQDGRSESSMEG